MKQESIFRLDLPLHEEMRLEAFRVGPENGHPRVGILAGIHGDEWNGPYLAYLLLRRLAEMESRGRVLGRITVIPAGNPLGINLGSRFWPFDGSNLNGLFPGYDQGETTQRIAAAIFQTLSDSDYCLDLHAANEHVKAIPQVRLFEGSHAFAGLARSFGLDLIWRRATTSPLVKSFFSYQIGRLGIPTFVLPFGTARRLNHFYAERAFRGVLSFLEEVEAIRPAPGGRILTEAERAGSLLRDEEGVQAVVARSSGLFVMEAELGTRVRRGERIGSLVDPLEPESPPTPVDAEIAGLLTMIRVSPLSYEGSLLARIARDEGAGKKEADR